MKQLGIILLGSICFWSLFSAGQMEVTFAAEKVTLRVGYLPLLPQLPLIVSYENDRMSFSHIDLRLDKYNSFTALEAAFRVKAIDAASIPVPIALSIAADDPNIKVLGTCHIGGSRLVAGTPGGLESVRGKLIGVPGFDSSENLMLDKVLQEVKLRCGIDYRVIEAPFNTAIDNLKAKELDALFLPEPFGTMAEKEKIAVAVEGQKGRLTGTLTTILVIRTDVLESNPAGVEEWLKSLVNACRFIEKDVTGSGAKQTAVMQTSYFHFPQEIVIESLINRRGDLKFDHFIPDPNEIKILFDLATQAKLINKSIDFNRLIHVDLMKRITQ
ncbi:MAG: ABC transporter substrate-binding protein [Deltaproteobacteria bacterium]|nr:ABC transporter substrate-binding protein [Deltaproteobacteria bacterium]